MLILATKLKNALPANYSVMLRNVSINGDKRGCTGFIQHDGKTVYVNTELSCAPGYMARTAAQIRDCRGGRNHWAKDLTSLVTLINQLIVTPHIPT